MAINASIDGQTYSNILSIITGGKVVELTAPGGTLEMKTGSCNFKAGFKVEHGCGKKPKYVIAYVDDIDSLTPTLNKTSIAVFIAGLGSFCIVSSGSNMWNSAYMVEYGTNSEDVDASPAKQGLIVNDTYIKFYPAIGGYDAPATWYAIYEV